MTENTGEIGIPHDSDAEPNSFTGADPNANVGEPDALGAPIGIPAVPD